MTDQFQQLLLELGQILNLPLHVDKHAACSIRVHERTTIQLQLDISMENLYLFSKIVEIPPGKFRENVLKEALKANGLPDPRVGVLSYFAASNHLALYQRYPLEILNGERLSGIFGAFLEYSESWRKAIESSQASPPSSSAPPSSNPFGLKP